MGMARLTSSDQDLRKIFNFLMTFILHTITRWQNYVENSDGVTKQTDSQHYWRFSIFNSSTSIRKEK